MSYETMEIWPQVFWSPLFSLNNFYIINLLSFFGIPFAVFLSIERTIYHITSQSFKVPRLLSGSTKRVGLGKVEVLNVRYLCFYTLLVYHLPSV